MELKNTSGRTVAVKAKGAYTTIKPDDTADIKGKMSEEYLAHLKTVGVVPAKAKAKKPAPKAEKPKEEAPKKAED